MCQACTATHKVLQCNTRTHGSSLAPKWTTNHYKILTLTYKGICNMAPKYIVDLLKANELKMDNMWSNKAGLKLKLSLVKYNTFATRSFSYPAATLWNALPTNIPECKLLDKFKCSLKMHLYRKAFNLQVHAWY